MFLFFPRKTFISVVRGFYTKPIAQICVPYVSKFMYFATEYHSVCTVYFFKENLTPDFKYDMSLGVACWPLVPKFAGSNPAEAVGFLRAKKNPQHAFLRRGSKAVGPMS